jgi:hypothetical protein
MAADFESLDFLYMPSSDVARDLAFARFEGRMDFEPAEEG